MVPEMSCILTTTGWINLPAGKLSEMTVQSLGETGRFWHDAYMPRHFQIFATAKYRYQHRSPAYNRRKVRKFGHGDPLVFKGASRNLALLPPRISRRGGKVTVVLPGIPRYFYYAPVLGKRQPPKMQELGRLASDEANRMAALYAKGFEARLAADRSVVVLSPAGSSGGSGAWSPEGSGFQAT